MRESFSVRMSESLVDGCACKHALRARARVCVCVCVCVWRARGCLHGFGCGDAQKLAQLVALLSHRLHLPVPTETKGKRGKRAGRRGEGEEGEGGDAG